MEHQKVYITVFDEITNNFSQNKRINQKPSESYTLLSTAWLHYSLTDTCCWGGMWIVISDRQLLESHTI